MPTAFVISDTHFGHANILTFTSRDGKPVRTFASAEEMDECMIQRWNETVKPGDKVYHLGDVAINRRFISIVGRLNGSKVLIKGNHDIFPLKDYTNVFRDIRAYHVYGDRSQKSGRAAILCHVPIHPSQLGRFPLCIHGHLHSEIVRHDDGSPDVRYKSVCVEHTDYRPVPLDSLLEGSR
jgi:calcineurin-like phosphoesterase family protein